MSYNSGVAERRRHSRVKFDNIIKVGGNGWWKNQKAISKDISFRGCSFYVNRSADYSKDELIEVTLFPPKQFVDAVFDSRCKIKGRIVREESANDPTDGDKRCVAVEFQDDLRTIIRRIYTIRRIFTIAMIPIVLLGVFVLQLLNVQYFWYQPLMYSYSIIVTGYILSRFLFSLFYRTPRDSGYEPTVSIIIPVLNEEKMIGETILRCFRSEYPAHKLEVIVVNDGSTDRTLQEILKVKKQYPDLVLIDFDQNKGKRQAMIAGTHKAIGDIIVYMDSDSLISTKDSLYQLVQGFADPSVGAVSGHVNVLNADENILTRMQEVGYFLGFRVMKAAESIFSNVTCCSGPLSAYRRDYVMRVLDTWLDPRFLSKAAELSDDRSMTRLILKDYRTLYTHKAAVDTLVPNKWFIYLKQQVRWKKSWFRENILASLFMWRKNPLAALGFYLDCLLTLFAPLVIFWALVCGPLFQKQPPTHCVAGLSLIGLLWAFAYRLLRPNNKWICALLLCFLYVTILCWQTYFAIFTLNKNRWGTR